MIIEPGSSPPGWASTILVTRWASGGKAGWEEFAHLVMAHTHLEIFKSTVNYAYVILASSCSVKVMVERRPIETWCRRELTKAFAHCPLIDRAAVPRYAVFLTIQAQATGRKQARRSVALPMPTFGGMFAIGPFGALQGACSHLAHETNGKRLVKIEKWYTSVFIKNI